MKHGNVVYHDAIVDEAPSVPCRLQVWIFFCAGHSDVPDLLPGLIQLDVNWVDPGVMWSHCVPHVSRYAMLLQNSRGRDIFRSRKRTHNYSKFFFSPADLSIREAVVLGQPCIYLYVAHDKNRREMEGTGITV